MWLDQGHTASEWQSQNQRQCHLNLLGSFLYHETLQFLCQQACGCKAFLACFIPGSCQGLWRAAALVKGTHDPQHHRARQGEPREDPVTTGKGSDSTAWVRLGTNTPRDHSSTHHWQLSCTEASWGQSAPVEEPEGACQSRSCRKPWGRTFAAHLMGASWPVTLVPTTNHGFWDM